MAYNREYITEFDRTSELAAFSGTSQCLKPHVSLTNDDGVIHFIREDYGGHSYVEIGGIKWATMNVGATSVTDIGQYFAWADRSGYTASQIGRDQGEKYFSWSSYPLSNDDGTVISKYNSTDGKTVIEGYNDAAVRNWGGVWRMPTAAEYKALENATTYSSTTNYEGTGVSGLVLTDKTDSSKKLFFPACGYVDGATFNNLGGGGIYWSSSVDTDDYQKAICLGFAAGRAYMDDTHIRYNGGCVRAVAN